MLTRSRSKSVEGSVSEDSEQCSSSQTLSLSQATDSAPQEEYVKKKKGRSLNRKRQTHVAQWVCILPESINGQHNDYESSFISLKDPKTGCLKKYYIKRQKVDPVADGACEVCEVTKLSDEPRSWFIDNTVQTDGCLFVCTPIDPLFIALPYLQAAAKCGKFTTLAAILDDSDLHCSRILEQCVNARQWEHVCDYKELANEMKVFKYSWDKTRVWLKSKVDALATSLEREGVYVGAGSLSTTLVRSNRQKDISRDDYLRYACGLVSDYLPPDIADKLSLDYPVPSRTESQVLGACKHKRDGIEANGPGEPPAKKGKTTSDNGEPEEDYTKYNSRSAVTKQATNLTSAQKVLAKVDKKGMKSISSFFSSKPKKKN